MGCKPERSRLGAALLALAALGAIAAARPAGDPVARRWVEQGREAYRVGEHFRALDLARQAQARASGDPTVLEFSAQLVRDAQGVVPALPLFERALKAAPDDPDLLTGYAATLAEAGRHRDMLRIARRMIELDPRDPRGYWLQAVLAARAGHDDLARRLLWRTGDAYAEVPAGLLLTGVLELRAGNTRSAVDAFDALARRQPDNRTVQLLLGRALLADGEAGELVERLRPWADRGDAPAYLLALVGRGLEHLGQRREAAAYLDRAGRPLPPGIAAQALSAEAETALLRSATDPSRPDAVVPRIRQAVAAGRGGEAKGLAQNLAARFPGSADVARLLGDAQLAAGDPAAALASYARAAQVRRDFALVERMALAWRRLGRESEAYALVADYLADNPRQAGAAHLLGEMAAARADWRHAATLLGHAATLGPNDPRLLADLSGARLALGDAEGALAAARRAQALQRGNAQVARQLGLALRATGRVPEAEAQLAKARRFVEASAAP